MKIDAVILGASGYGGGELLYWLSRHPHVASIRGTSRSRAGQPFASAHPNLRGVVEGRFEATIPWRDLEASEQPLVFSALPHGELKKSLGALESEWSSIAERMLLIDLSGDFRLGEMDVFKHHYKLAHTAPELQSEFVYGLTETNREAVKGAKRIANPGCFATATLLALAPLVKGDLLAGRVIVDAKTGSSGSGAKAAANTHHPQRANSFYAYKPFTHQHVPEIEQELKRVGDWTSELVFMTHSLPVPRGIFASCYVELKNELTHKEVEQVYQDFYHDDFFVRLVESSPDINHVKTTNFCDIGFAVRGRSLVVFSALDNLVKGAAGQGIQNMNLMFGFDETTGLMLAGSNP